MTSGGDGSEYYVATTGVTELFVAAADSVQ